MRSWKRRMLWFSYPLYMVVSLIIGMWHLMILLIIASCIMLEMDCKSWNWTWWYQYHQTIVPFSWLKFSRRILYTTDPVFAILLCYSLNCCIHKWMVKWPYFSHCSFMTMELSLKWTVSMYERAITSADAVSVLKLVSTLGIIAHVVLYFTPERHGFITGAVVLNCRCLSYESGSITRQPLFNEA